eukprot:jgi/Psemu1/26723/gm1.26723_g
MKENSINTTSSYQVVSTNPFLNHSIRGAHIWWVPFLTTRTTRPASFGSIGRVVEEKSADPSARGNNKTAPLRDKLILIKYKKTPRQDFEVEKSPRSSNKDPPARGINKQAPLQAYATLVQQLQLPANQKGMSRIPATMKDKPDRQMLLQKVTACLSNGVIPSPLTDPASLFRRLQPRFADGVEVSWRLKRHDKDCNNN